MLEFLSQHQFWAAVAVYWIFSAAVSAMPEPQDADSSRYLWLYRFLHTTAGNITTAIGNRIPGLKILILMLLVPLMFSTAACAALYNVHPGALNTADSAAYDTLLIARTAIDQGRMDYQAGRLPQEARDALNALIQSYNIARESWLTYRGAIATSVPPDPYFQRLHQNLTDLANAIGNLQRKGVKP